MKGKVTLVGAGPGDPELISLKGLRAIEQAEVILYDALVHPDLLKNAQVDTLKIFVGKRYGEHSFKQEEINGLIIKYAIQGLNVVRLKGGDPFVFARGKEEIDYAQSFNIETSIIPGISSVNLAGLYGFPLTVRGVNESFWVVTATTKNGELSKDVELVAQSTATGVFLMGLRKLALITDIYKSHWRNETPVAIISKGSLADAQIVTGTVETIDEIIANNQVASPAIILIGEAIGTHEKYFEPILAEIEKL